MSNVVELQMITTLDIDPQRVLRIASEKNLTDVVIIGYDPEGHQYFASSVADGGAVLWMMEHAKLLLLKVAREGTE